MAFANDDRRNIDALFVMFGKNPHTSQTKRGPRQDSYISSANIFFASSAPQVKPCVLRKNNRSYDKHAAACDVSTHCSLSRRRPLAKS
jgi:hypothetical protein